MKEIHLQIARLRKSRGMTQQELGEKLNVSYQTVSKWENGVTLPDITMLPKLSSLFGVSVDGLLGLVLVDEEYRPTDTNQSEHWRDQGEKMQLRRGFDWNEDYMDFLVKTVWKISHPVRLLDCGCGTGFLGQLLLPLLPPESSYTGVDFTEEMLTMAKRLFAQAGLQGRFILSDIGEMNEHGAYDMVVSQAVLRHSCDGERLVQKMADLAADGGLVVCIECNREFEADGLYVEGMDYSALCRHEGLEALWKTEWELQGRDYAVAVKLPHMLRRAGLCRVGVRMNDRVTYLAPDQEDYHRTLAQLTAAERWETSENEAKKESLIRHFMNHGMDREQAEKYCGQQRAVSGYLRDHKESAALTRFGGMVISYGWK